MTAESPQEIGRLVANVATYRDWLAEAKGRAEVDFPWYPYDILGNITHLDALLTGPHRDLGRLADGLPVADIGSADGDLAFALERECGWSIDIIDTADTNMNGLQAARVLRNRLGSAVEVHDIDLDTQFRLPRERYGLVLLLGILYHLQNPYFVLRALSQHSSYLLLSTRVARFAGPQRTAIAELPVAYLVGPAETNNDATNYWMFSPAGLERLVRRAGWLIVESISFGDVDTSDPSSANHDERQFMLLRSGRAKQAPPVARVAEATHGRDLPAASGRVIGLVKRLLSGGTRSRGGSECSR